MKRKTIVSSVGLMAVLAGGAAWAMRGQPQPGPYAIEMKPDGMQLWMESQKPGKFHEWLGQTVGEWKTELEMPGSGMPASTGSSTITWQIPGLWTAETLNSEMPMGMPAMSGHGLLGYDNIKKQYVGCWVDNTSTEMKTFRGGLSPDGRVLTMYGTMDEPMTGENGKMVRYQTTRISEDQFRFEVAEIIYGEPFVVVRVTYTRR